MGAFELATLWAAGILAGATVGKFGGNKHTLIKQSLPFFIPGILIALGAIVQNPWQQVVWLSAIIFVLCNGSDSRLSKQSPSRVLIFILPLALIILSTFSPLSAYTSQIIGASLIFSAICQILSLRRSPSSLFPRIAVATLSVFCLLAGLLLAITDITNIWLLQPLLATSLLVLCILLLKEKNQAIPEHGNINVQQAVSNERERIYQNLHDDIGSRLLSLIHRAKTPEEADFARCLLQDLRDAVARTVQLHITLAELIADQKHETEQRLHSLNIKMQWPSARDISDIPLPPVSVAVIKRSLRELISNIIRHAQAHNIWLDCRVSDHTLELLLSDDGIGLPAPVKQGRGMNGIQNRMQSLKGDAKWLSSPSMGTRVELRIPLNGESIS